MVALAIYALLLGSTMKLADLADEHGVRFFRGDRLVLGVCWGAAGVLLVLSGNDIANVILAMVLAFLVRMRLDYYNHALATAMVVVAFVFRAQVDAAVLVTFLASFTAFGFLRDYFGNVRKKKDLWYKINEPAWYYLVPPVIYSAVSGDWAVSVVCIAYIVAYDAVKLAYKGF